MTRAFGLAALFAGLVVAPVSGTAKPRAMAVNAFLCDSAAYAIQFADVIAEGQIDEIAKDRVGRAAGAEVCGQFAGMAAIESESVMLKQGTAYKVTAFRFREDGRVAWLAERTFAPVSTYWDL